MLAMLMTSLAWKSGFSLPGMKEEEDEEEKEISVKA